MKRTIVAVDGFCGAGGTSTGLALASEDLGLVVDLTAINHWDVAIATHTLNHPWAAHVNDNIEAIDPAAILNGRKLTLLVASPPCTHFSTARGGKPRDDQQRSTPRYLLRWIDAGEPEYCLFENVPEWAKWGPIDEHGKVIKAHEREYFEAFIEEIRARGYRVEHRVLNAADHGDPTSRKRLFVIARRGTGPIPWPVQTHSKGGKVPGTKPWRGAAEIIDWALHGKSVWGRKRPLAKATLRRIATGFRRKHPGWEPLAKAIEEGDGPVPLRVLLDAGLPDEALTSLVSRWLGVAPAPGARAFTLGQHGGAALRPGEEPVATIAAGGAVRLVEALAFLLPPLGFHTREGQANAPRSLEEALQTLTQRGGGHLIDAVLYHVTHGGRLHDPANPLPTVTGAARGELATAEAVLFGAGGAARQGEPRDPADPIPTVLTHSRLAVADPFLTTLDRPETNRSLPRGLDEPLPTITATKDRIASIAAVLTPQFGERDGQAPRSHALEEPTPAVTSHGAGLLAQAVLSGYYGNGRAHNPADPVPTLTTRDRYALAEAVLTGLMVDVHARMLQPHELARAMSFPTWYRFTGTRQQVIKQIGNAVAVSVAKALCAAILAELTREPAPGASEPGEGLADGGAPA